MAEDNIFTRLGRLFSTNVIVRNVGGRKLKVVDTSSRQTYAKRGSRDRYSRLHTNVPYGAKKGDRFAYQAVRVELFRDYDAMDGDPIIASALDIYADESTTKDEYGDILTIHSKNSQVKDVLHNLFYDILNIEFNLWPWTRNLCKYGDHFLWIDIDEEVGITNVVPLSPYFVTRHEGDEKTKNPYKVIFRLDDSYVKYSRRKDEELQNYEVAHFRLLSDSNFLPYGKAMIENGRRVWKQLKLMEDAMMIHRITRAPEKRVFKIDIGNIPPAEVDAFMERTVSKMKRAVLIDPETGEYNLRFNLQNMVEDFYLPVRGGDSGTSIDTTPGLTYESIDDIEYLKGKLLASLKIPKAFIGYEEGVDGKATLAAEDIRFARTIERIQRILVSELTKIAIIHLYVQGFADEDLVSFSLELTNPSTIYEQEKVNLWAEKISLAQTMKDSRLINSAWIYENIFDMNKKQYEKIKEGVIEDLKLQFRHEQIAESGNDPAISGKKEEVQNPGQVPPGPQPGSTDSDLKKGGRPKEPGDRGQDKNAFGRDPDGRKGKEPTKAGSADRKRTTSEASFEERAEKLIMDIGLDLSDFERKEAPKVLSEEIEKDDVD